MIDTTLYGLNKDGSFKVWTITTDEQGLITVRHGKEGGKLQTKSEQVKAVNVGKSNETSLAQQAVNEANGKIKKQKDKGYREDKLELSDIPLLAMLAQDYNKVGHRIQYPCYGSVKYDGVRCLVKKNDGTVTLESRTGQLYDVPHIVTALQDVMEDGDVLDGEIYLHGYVLQDIVSAVKRTDTQKAVDKAQKAYDKAPQSSTLAELEEAQLIHELRPKLELHVFDKVELDVPFETRLGLLDEYMDRITVAGPIKKTQYFLIASEAEMKEHHAAAVAQGYEGIMLRNVTGIYESGKRSADLQKYKEFLDFEFVILDVVEDKDGLAVFVMQNVFADNTFNVIMGSKDQKAGYLRDKDILKGKLLTVKYQSLYKDTMKPQFPCGLAIRDYE